MRASVCLRVCVRARVCSVRDFSTDRTRLARLGVGLDVNRDMLWLNPCIRRVPATKPPSLGARVCSSRLTYWPFSTPHLHLHLHAEPHVQVARLMYRIYGISLHFYVLQLPADIVLPH